MLNTVFLFEVMLAVQKGHEEWLQPFLILMCAATVSDRLNGVLGMLDPLRIECPKRPYELERYEVDMGSLQELWQVMATAAAHVLRKGKTSLFFIPGLGEIDKVEQLLSAKGVAEGDFFILHADFAADVIEEAKKGRQKNSCRALHQSSRHGDDHT